MPNNLLLDPMAWGMSYNFKACIRGDGANAAKFVNVHTFQKPGLWLVGMLASQKVVMPTPNLISGKLPRQFSWILPYVLLKTSTSPCLCLPYLLTV